jgi:hypothetical protein
MKTKKDIQKLLNKGLKVKCCGTFNYNSKQWEFDNVKTSKEYKENYLDSDDFNSIYN